MTKRLTKLKKIQLLLWKNFVLQWNKTILEIFLPLLACTLFLVLRSFTTPKNMPEKSFELNKLESLELLQKVPNISRVLAYSPRNELLDKVMAEVLKTFNNEIQSFRSFENVYDMGHAVAFMNFLAVIEFSDDFIDADIYPKNLSFKLRFPRVLRNIKEDIIWKTTWKTNQLYPNEPVPGPRNPQAVSTDGQPIGYFIEGFLQIQHAITMAYIKLAGNQAQLPKVYMQRFPYPKYVEDDVIESIRQYFPFLLVISFLPITFVAESTASEKEKPLKETMKIMGIPSWMHWTAWFLYCFIVYSIVCLILTGIFKIPTNNGLAVFIYSDALVILIFFLLYIFAFIWFFFMITVFFNKATTAAPVAGLTYLLLLALAEPGYESMNTFQKILLCLNLNIALDFGIRIIVKWEVSQEGVNRSNLFKTVNEDENLSLGVVLVMLFVTGCLYMLICLYSEQVFPGEYGVPERWNFCFKSNCCCPEERQSILYERPTIFERYNPLAFEEEPRNGHVGITVKSLKKRFGKKWAVKDFSLHLFENEVGAVLGHNGAGKTTVVKILTGMMPSTSGTALIYGYDISSNLDDVSASIGIFLQRNALYDKMSVYNHLKFFAELRGLHGRKLKVDIDKYLEKLKLKENAHIHSSKLNKLMKRKLALCCALCGRAKVIFLDEPSSDMDPAARRQLWKFLQTEKIGRTVLLATNLIDEAEALGDRITIMSDGELLCYGTAFFLKKKLGLGYKLTCEKLANCNVVKITKLLSKYISDIHTEADTETKLIFRLPDTFSGIFGELLKDLENNMSNLGLSAYDMEFTTLEDVFDYVVMDDEFVAGLERYSGGQDKEYKNQKKKAKQDDNKSAEVSTEEEPIKDSRGIVVEPRKRKKYIRVLNKIDGAHDLPHVLPKNEEVSTQEEPLTDSQVINKNVGAHDLSKMLPKMEKVDMAKSLKTDDVNIDEEHLTNSKANLNKIDGEHDLLKNPLPIKASKPSSLRSVRESIGLKSVTWEQNEKDEDLKSKARRSIAVQTYRQKFQASAGLYKQRKSFLNIDDTESQNAVNLKKKSSICKQWQAMMYKKIILTKHNLKYVLFQIFIAIATAIFAILAAKLLPIIVLPSMTYSLRQYSKALSLLEVANNIGPDQNEFKIADKYLKRTQFYGDNYVTEITGGADIQRYLIEMGKEEKSSITKSYLVGATINTNEIIAWYNNQPYHITPLALNLVHNAMAKHYIDPEAEIIVKNHPLLIADENRFKKEEAFDITFVFVIISLGMSLLISYYVIFLINERKWHSKLLQFISGVQSVTFWLTHFIWDFFMMFIISLIIILTMSAFQVPAYSGFEILSYYFLLLLVFCFAALPFTYVLSTFFKEPMVAFSIIAILNFFIASVLIVATQYIIRSWQHGWMHSLTYIFLFLPQYALMRTWVKLDGFVNRKIICEEKSIKEMPETEKCLQFPACCQNIANEKYAGDYSFYVAMLITGIVSLLYLILRDHRFSLVYCNPNKSQEVRDFQVEVDEDVKVEKELIANMSKQKLNEYYLVLDRVEKFYGKFNAVKDISFRAKGKECFGLLGLSGAGKTTTLKMLVGEERLCSGNAYLLGINIEKNLAKIYKNIGYCPQTSASLSKLTAREIIFIFCLLRGIRRKRIKKITEDLASAFDFSKHIDEPNKTYNEADKKKLSIALALISAPIVIYLDEPTTGMDSVAQHQVWNIIDEVRKTGKLIVLTTSNIDEVEALCTRAAIMVNGEFKCIGSMEHLKSKFQRDLVLQIKVESTQELTKKPLNFWKIENRMKSVQNAVFAQYPNAKIESAQHSILTILIPLANMKWSEIFTWIEQNRSQLQIEDYSISRETLQDVFLNFATQNEEDMEVVKKKIL